MDTLFLVKRAHTENSYISGYMPVAYTRLDNELGEVSSSEE